MKIHPFQVLLLTLVISSPAMASCEDEYFKITINGKAVSARMVTMTSELKEVGSYNALIDRDEQDRKTAVEDNNLPTSAKVPMMIYLDSNIRNARCRRALNGK